MAQVINTSKQLGAEIARARHKRGLTQTELANLSGLRQATISQIEQGHEAVKFSTIATLFAVLGLELTASPHYSNSAKRIEDIF